MWWSDGGSDRGLPPRRRHVLAAGLAMAATGCGFRPLYDAGTPIAGLDTAAALARIEVRRIAERSGQILRRNLIQILNPSGAALAPLYTLTVTLAVSEQPLGIRDDDTAEQANVTITAAWVLTDVQGESVQKGRVRRFTSFAILSDEFATRSGARTAEYRALEIIATDIRTRLALAVSRTPSA